MKRRDFVRNTALTALGASLINPIETLAGASQTYLESEDVSPRAAFNDDFPLNFVAIGDWGRNGEYHQNEVAKQMGDWAAAHPNKFIVSVGDNFYPKGVVSENDPLWYYSFENVYTAHSLQYDWYPVLGNHDYGTDPDAQVRYSKVSRRWNMPALYYSKEVNIGHDDGNVLLVFIDTQPIVYDLKEREPQKQLAWINQTLQQASADVKWKIVIGHHPGYTVGPRIKNYDTLAIRKALTGIFEKHKVDVFLSGHEHSLQHLKTEGFPHQFISGAGSELTEVTAGIPNCRFQASEHGFLYFSINRETLRVNAVNDSGKVLYETIIRK